MYFLPSDCRLQAEQGSGVPRRPKAARILSGTACSAHRVPPLEAAVNLRDPRRTDRGAVHSHVNQKLGWKFRSNVLEHAERRGERATWGQEEEVGQLL